MYTIYSGNRCQYCEMAKGLLKAKGLEFIEVNIDRNPSAKEFVLNEGHRSVPQLYNDLHVHVASGFEGIESYLKRL